MSIAKRVWTDPTGERREAWVVRYADAGGKRRLKTLRTKKEADAFALRAGGEIRDGVHIADAETITIAQAADLWLRAGEDAGLETGTIGQRRAHIGHHISPFIGATKLNRLTAPAVRLWQEALRDAGRSATMIRRVTTSLGAIIGEAQARGLAGHNPVREAGRALAPRVDRRERDRLAVGRDIPDNSEIRALVAAAEGRYRAAILLACFAGLRSSEITGLRWCDLDLTGGTVSVRQRSDRQGMIGAPKSASGRRTIPLPPLVINALREHRLRTGATGGEALVFGTRNGRPDSHHNWTRRGLNKALGRAGLMVESGERDGEGKPILAPKYSPHSLRHWFCSWCLAPVTAGGLGLTLKETSVRMGHSSIALTADRYGHLLPRLDDAAALAAAERQLLG